MSNFTNDEKLYHYMGIEMNIQPNLTYFKLTVLPATLIKETIWDISY